MRGAPKARDARCGRCAGCSRTPPSPCDVWIKRALTAFQKELNAKRAGIVKVLRDFDNRHED